MEGINSFTRAARQGKHFSRPNPPNRCLANPTVPVCPPPTTLRLRRTDPRRPNHPRRRRKYSFRLNNHRHLHPWWCPNRRRLTQWCPLPALQRRSPRLLRNVHLIRPLLHMSMSLPLSRRSQSSHLTFLLSLITYLRPMVTAAMPMTIQLPQAQHMILLLHLHLLPRLGPVSLLTPIFHLLHHL